MWRGGASIFAKAVLTAHGAQRDVHLVDSFQGLPPPTTGNDHDVRDAACNPEDCLHLRSLGQSQPCWWHCHEAGMNGAAGAWLCVVENWCMPHLMFLPLLPQVSLPSGGASGTTCAYRRKRCNQLLSASSCWTAGCTFIRCAPACPACRCPHCSFFVHAQLPFALHRTGHLRAMLHAFFTPSIACALCCMALPIPHPTGLLPLCTACLEGTGQEPHRSAAHGRRCGARGSCKRGRARWAATLTGYRKHTTPLAYLPACLATPPRHV